jgi:hypothetical protein
MQTKKKNKKNQPNQKIPPHRLSNFNSNYKMAANDANYEADKLEDLLQARLELELQVTEVKVDLDHETDRVMR